RIESSSFPVRLVPKESAFRSVGPDEVLSLSGGSANVCRWSARLGKHFGISVWLDPLPPATCRLNGTAPESNVRAAADSVPPNHHLAFRLRASACLDPPNDSVATSTLVRLCLLPLPTPQ